MAVQPLFFCGAGRIRSKICGDMGVEKPGLGNLAKIIRKKRADAKMPDSDAVRADCEWDRVCGEFADFATDWLWETDADLRIAYVSDRIRRIVGVDPAFYRGKRRDEYAVETVDPDGLRRHLDDLKARRPFERFVYAADTPQGRRYVQISGHPVYDDTGEFLCYRGIGSQVTAQIMAEQRASLSDRQFVDALEGLSVGIARYDSEDRIQYWNSAYETLYPEAAPVLRVGRKYEEILRHLAEAGVVPDAAGRVDAWLSETIAARKAGREPFEVMLGDGRWVLVSDHRTSGGGMMNIHSDITPLKKREEELRQSEQRFARAFQFSPGTTAIAEIDDGTLIDVNETWLDRFGWSRDEVIGKSVQELGIWENAEDRKAFIAQLEADGRVRDFETRHRTRTGEVLDMVVAGETVPLDGKPRLLIVGHDITARKRAERELRQSEARLAGVLRIAPEAVVVVDSEQRIALFNDGAERVFGYTADDAKGKKLDILIPQALRERHKAHIDEFAGSPDVSSLMSGRLEISALRKDGSTFPAEASVAKLEVGGETLLTVLLHDITERKRVEQSLLHAKEEAELASRAKSDFLANMSHELRTPLNAILGFSEVILNDSLGRAPNGKYWDYVRDIHSSGAHLLEIISDILDLSKIDAGQESLDEDTVDIAETVEACRRLIRERATDAGIEITADIPVGLPALRCDRRKLKQMLINLLSNSVNFTGRGGRIWIEASLDGAAGALLVTVRDTGIGMRAEDIPRALEPFTRIEGSWTSRREGTGLGLPLVTKLAELHGGSVDIDSAPGRGTAVTLTFPADRVVAAVEAPAITE